MTTPLTIRDLRPEEFDALGQLMVEVYSHLDGFPTPEEQPGYYELLGFARSEDLDFLPQGFPVFGFRLQLAPRG